MKRVIVNADDFGLDEHTFEWTVKGFECGALTSATIMAGMPYTKKAVEYAKAHPQYSFGVHLCLVDEKPVSDPAAIPSMVDPKTGKLWATVRFIIRNFLGLVKVEDIVTEMRAQIGQLKEMGLKISHVDGHGHNHRLPQAIKALEVISAQCLVQSAGEVASGEWLVASGVGDSGGSRKGTETRESGIARARLAAAECPSSLNASSGWAGLDFAECGGRHSDEDTPPPPPCWFPDSPRSRKGDTRKLGEDSGVVSSQSLVVSGGDSEELGTRNKELGTSGEGGVGSQSLVVRRCQDVVVGRMGMLGTVINGPMQRRLMKAGFGMTDHFAMNAGHTMAADWFTQLMKNLPEGVTEIGLHPGVDEEWRRIDTEDCFANCRRLCEELNVKPVTFKDI